jgi:hypothetical protein
MRAIAVVTTFNEDGLKKYAQRMLDSFAKNWPKEVKLYAYAEDCTPNVTAENIIVRDLHASSPELVAFKNKWKDVPKANGDVSKDPRRSRRKDAGKGFKWDAIRFSHKVYSVFHCAKNCNEDLVVWMDADMFCHSPITLERVYQLFPSGKDLCYVGRERKWPECGLYSIDIRSKGGKNFLEEFQRVYDDAENGIFQMEEWHDSFVFEMVRRKIRPVELNWSAGIIKGEGHPLINSPWGAYLDHLKGGRKALGKSKKTDLVKPRSELYWRTI